MGLKVATILLLCSLAAVSPAVYRFTPFMAEPVYIYQTRYDQPYQPVIRSQYFPRQQQQYVPYIYDPYNYNYQGGYQFSNDLDSTNALNEIGEKPAVHNIPALANGMFNGKITITGPKPIINIQALTNGQFQGPIKVESGTQKVEKAASEGRRKQQPQQQRDEEYVYISDSYSHYPDSYSPYLYPVWDEYLKA